MLPIPIAGRASYLAGANNLGIVAAADKSAVVIDTGIDKDTGRALKKALDEAGLRLHAIISTHHHADHVGGNEYLLRAFPEVEVYAPPIEAALIRHPLLEPVYLSLGAYPSRTLQTKWLLSKGSLVHHLIGAPSLAIAGITFEVVALPGHSIDQIGVAVDGVCFAADGFFGTSVLQKHGIPYAHDIAAQLASLDTLGARGDQFFLPGHGTLVAKDEIAQQLAANQAAIERGSALVRAAIGAGGTVSVIAARVATALNHTLAGLPQHAIFVSAVSAHLTYLEQQGVAALVLDEGEARWIAS